MDEQPRHRYLNRENRWADFEWTGLELGDDGTLRLDPLPLVTGPLPAELSGRSAPVAPAGIAVLPSGDVYLTAPANGVLARVEACDPVLRPLPGAAAGRLRAPAGLAFHPGRDALLVADPGAGGLLVVAVADLALAELWEVPDCRSVAVGPDGRVYLVAGGALHEVDPVGRRGEREVDPAGRRGEPIAFSRPAREVTVSGDEVVVLCDGGEVVVRGPRGRHTFSTGLPDPHGLAAAGDVVHVGSGGRVLSFRDGRLLGAVRGWDAPVAALAVDGASLLVHPGGAAGTRPGAPGGLVAPVRLARRGAAATTGRMVGGPFPNPGDGTDVHHLLRADVLGPSEGLALHVHSRRRGAPPPPADPRRADLFDDPAWSAVTIPPGATVARFPGSARDEVWVGVEMIGDGLGGPVLDQMRLDHTHEGYQARLPAIYRSHPGGDDFLGRWLAVFETEFDALHELVDDLATLADPSAVDPALLPWLAGWLGEEPDGDLPPDRVRSSIATAFARSGERGTTAGLRAAIRDRTGVDVLVEEPVRQAGWWVLPADAPTEAEAAMSRLGAGTVTVPAEYGGAVLGTTALLGGSFVIEPGSDAGPLFDDVAHRVTVRVHRGARFSRRTVADVEDVLARELPAHVASHVCVVGPGLRVGVQARLGVDAVLSGASAPGTPTRLGAADGLRLGGDPPEALDGGMRVGRSRLGDR